MYNRYIGNTGKYYRVEDIDDISKASEPVYTVPEPPAPHVEEEPLPINPDSEEHMKETAPSHSSNKDEKKKRKISFEPEKIEQIPGNLRGLIKNHLPESIDLGDILLVLVLLFLFIENDDDEVLLVLIILIFMWVKPLLIKDDDEDKEE